MTERNWNIKIPGFGSEETKPVRKQPVNENHKQRLNAVRKAKK
jgi:transcription initiation factor TFIID subunit TAF12